jgi:transcriptional regulator with XRE-family HTH domain
MKSQPDRNLSLRAHLCLWQGRPTALRIALGGHLRRLREANGITREAAGHAIRTSSSKISRMELGRVACKERDVADLLILYGVTDAEERQTIVDLVHQANTRGWWREYGDVLPSWFETYLGLEQGASVIRIYDPQLVPGLLQTKDYARAVMRFCHVHLTAGEIERRVALRMARQAFLNQPGAPELWVALDEAALRRPVDGHAVQCAQLVHLIQLAQRPNITLQIVPFDAGGHAAAGGPFTILRFAEPDFPDIVYLEHLTNAVYLEKKHDTVQYLAIMDNLCLQAASPSETVTLLQKMVTDSDPPSTDPTVGIVVALARLRVQAGDRVLIMLPEGPGFAEAFAGVVQQGAVPLPVNPLLPADDIETVAAEAHARLMLIVADRIPALDNLEAEPPVLIDGPHGHWAAALRLR